jgi:hypothetical protein
MSARSRLLAALSTRPRSTRSGRLRLEQCALVREGRCGSDAKYNGLAAGGVIDSATKTRWGGAIGTGVEIGFAPGWSVASNTTTCSWATTTST